MAFDINGYAVWNASGNRAAPSDNGYKTSDALATVAASGYFNYISPSFYQGDLIYVVASDGIATYSITSADLAAVVTVALYPSVGRSLTGQNVATIGNTSGDSHIPVLYNFEYAGGATATITKTLVNTVVVIDAWVVMRGAGTTSDTVQVKNASSGITEALDIAAAADNAIVRFTQDAHATRQVSAAGSLAVTCTSGSGTDAPPMSIYVLAYVAA